MNSFLRLQIIVNIFQGDLFIAFDLIGYNRSHTTKADKWNIESTNVHTHITQKYMC